MKKEESSPCEGGERVKPDLRDFICLIGMGLLFAGLWMIYPPSALIVIGGLFLWLGLGK
jgi:hypothetical protein